MKLARPYVSALITEIQGIARRGDGGPLHTVYFGGGTPSMLDPSAIAYILDSTRTAFGIAPGAEVTLEAHPATVTKERLRGFRQAGVTRVSFGGESLDAHELALVGRNHTPNMVLRAIAWTREVGIESVGVDLIYGLPGQTVSSWESTLASAIDTGVDHLSLYPLSIEPKTVLARRQRTGGLSLPEDDMVVRMYLLACTRLRHSGYDHYEIANWAHPGHRCRHNVAYWLHAEYFGIGVGAHAYIRPNRTVNVSGTKRYIERTVAELSTVAELEEIDEHTDFGEFVMLRLRLLQDGLPLAEVSHRLGARAARFKDEAALLSEHGLIALDSDRIVLREEAVPVANEIWERLWVA
ncbi:MAG: radical SAM family heme chaperone HemW [Chloroflexota bacterium]